MGALKVILLLVIGAVIAATVSLIIAMQERKAMIREIRDFEQQQGGRYCDRLQ